MSYESAEILGVEARTEIEKILDYLMFDLPFSETQSIETNLSEGELSIIPLRSTVSPANSTEKIEEMILDGTSSMSTETLEENFESPSPSVDENGNSPAEDSEREMVNRRGLKKSGGPLRKLARFGNKQVVKYSDEYHDRRVKNNEAVKKSRLKAKERQKETEGKMQKLADENRKLNDRVDHLLKELQVLKSLYKELNQDIPSAAIKALDRVNVR